MHPRPPDNEPGELLLLHPAVTTTLFYYRMSARPPIGVPPTKYDGSGRRGYFATQRLRAVDIAIRTAWMRAASTVGGRDLPSFPVATHSRIRREMLIETVARENPGRIGIAEPPLPRQYKSRGHHAERHPSPERHCEDGGSDNKTVAHHENASACASSNAVTARQGPHVPHGHFRPRAVVVTKTRAGTRRVRLP